MSSILLINPFVSTAPQHSSVQETSVTALSVAPMQSLSAGNSSGNATAFSGSGSGYSSANDQQSAAAIVRDRAKSEMTPRLSEATSTSVVNAQTHKGAEITPFGLNLPVVEMPDPLPTSPFLLRMSVRD